MSGHFSAILDAHRPLQERISESRGRLDEIRKATHQHACLDNGRLCVYAAGSLGRLETGSNSDFDVFLVANNPERLRENPSISRLEEYEVFGALIQINSALGYPRFSGDGRFLKTYELDDMIKATGSPRDDSDNLFTARMLLVLESQPLTNDTLYDQSVERVVEHYFRDGAGRKDFRPLFFLNDVLRYWRTLCLNYEFYRNEPDRPWWKKNLNLKFSRKLTIFSTVLSLMSGAVQDRRQLIALCEMTPIQRLASALDEIEDEALMDDFKKLLDDYELFLQAKAENKVEDRNNPRYVNKYTDAAERFGQFFEHAVLSHRIDGVLRRYVFL